MPDTWQLSPDRYFSPEPQQRALARELHAGVAGLPLICPHGHVNPSMFSEPEFRFGTPVDLLITPDHYVLRTLYAQGVPLEALGVPRRDGAPAENDHRRIWQTFAENFYLFRGTPSGVWLAHELIEIFGVREKLTGESAQRVYDHLVDRLSSAEYNPRRLYEQFNIEVLATTDEAADPLAHHRAIQDSGWRARIIPTFRPDAVINLEIAGWRENLRALEKACNLKIDSYRCFVTALKGRRAFFKRLGAKATDADVFIACTDELSPGEAEALFQTALAGHVSHEEAIRFTGHMLMEMARMSIEDGLVMQMHVGSWRNHNPVLYGQFGPHRGGDMPISAEFTKGLHSLLGKYGNDPRLALIVFTLDESTYTRELAPLAGHYPALKLGPPWWFQDSPNGMARYFDGVMETAGLYNTAGFNDDTRALPSIPARHDLWRRASANWLAGLVVRGIIDRQDAEAMAHEMAYGLAKRAYRLDESGSRAAQ